MAAAYISANNTRDTQHIMPVFIKVTTITTGDWTTLMGYKGLMVLYGLAASIAANGPTTFSYATAAINAAGYDATTTSMAVASAAVTRSSGPYYVLTGSGEIMEVLSETTPAAATSTWTVRRGCLGTTASATGVANTNVVHILNMPILTNAAAVGATLAVAIPLPDDDKGAKVFGSVPR